MRTAKEAEAVGLIVDHHCYPNVAYAGPRFQPTHIENVMTEREAELTDELVSARQEIERLTEARRIDTLTVSHYVANIALSQLWKLLGANNQTAAVIKLKELLR